MKHLNNFEGEFFVLNSWDSVQRYPFNFFERSDIRLTDKLLENSNDKVTINKIFKLYGADNNDPDEGSYYELDNTALVQNEATNIFLHDKLYNFLKSLNIDDLWTAYRVELYLDDRKTLIPNYNHALITIQSATFMYPPWTKDPAPDTWQKTAGVKKSKWFDESSIKDDRMFKIGSRGYPIFRKDIKEKIDEEFPGQLSFTNLRDM